MKKTYCKLFFRFIQSIFAAVLGLRKLLRTQNGKFLSLDNRPRLTRRTRTDLNPDELRDYPYMVNLDGCRISCNAVDNLSDRLRIQNKTEDVN